MTKSYPYANTGVSVEKSKEDINNLLRKYSIHGASWTELWDEGVIEVRFPIEFEFKGIRKGTMVSLRPPMFESTHRSYDKKYGSQMVKAPDLKAGMRCLYFYVKTKLEAVQYGLTSIEKEFMSEIILKLPDGKEKSLGEVMTERIVTGDLSQLALEVKPPRQVSGNVIEAQ